MIDMLEWIVSSAVLAAALIGLHYLLRGKISARLQYALWLVLLVRLLVPFSIGKTALSIGNLLPDEPSEPVTAAVPEAPETVRNTEITDVTPETAGVPAAPAQPSVPAASEPEKPSASADRAENSASKMTQNSRKMTIFSPKILVFAWFFGFLFFSFWFIFCNFRYAKQLRAGILRRVASTDGRPELRLTRTALSPCLFGVFRPVIYLTEECAKDVQLLHHCAEHEYTHFLHRDHIWALLRGVCLALHWFDPFVWWAAALSRTDAELFCDEATIRRLGEDARADYGRSLIRMTCRETVDPFSAATTMSGRGGQLKTRIISITKQPKTAVPVLILVLLLCAAAVGCTMTGAQDTPVQQKDASTTEQTVQEKLEQAVRKTRIAERLAAASEPAPDSEGREFTLLDADTQAAATEAFSRYLLAHYDTLDAYGAFAEDADWLLYTQGDVAVQEFGADYVWLWLLLPSSGKPNTINYFLTYTVETGFVDNAAERIEEAFMASDAAQQLNGEDAELRQQPKFLSLDGILEVYLHQHAVALDAYGVWDDASVWTAGVQDEKLTLTISNLPGRDITLTVDPQTRYVLADWEDTVEFTTTQDTVVLSVPARYESEIVADDSFTIEEPVTGGHDLDDVLFSFYDRSQTTEDHLGLVWAIRAFAFEDPAELVKDGADRWVEENLVLLNTHLLGTRGNMAYYLFCLSPSDKAVRQYDSADAAAVSSYYRHAVDGVEILKDFIVRNGLAPVEGAVDWEAWYQDFILPGIEAETAAVVDAAWFAAREPVEQWPEFTVNGTSIYKLALDDIQNIYGTYERIYHWMDIQTSYYDIVQFADGSQAAGWVGEDEDGEIHHPNAAYLRLDAGVEASGVSFGEDYREAANRFPRDAEPVLEQVDEHTARLMLGGEVMYMGKFSYIEYTDGIPTMLVVCDETLMTFYIENGVIAAVSWMAPEESMRLPVTEEWAQQRMTIDPSLLTDENLRSILIEPEIALVNDGFTFYSPEDLSSDKLFMLFLYWSVDSTRDNYKQADGKYHFTQDFINGSLSHYFRTGSFTFDITQCGCYDASDGTAVIENVSGFGGGPDLRIADVQVLEGSTVQVTADFYNADPFMNGSGGELRYARKVYTLEFYNTGVLFQSAQFAPLPEDDLRAALQLHTGEKTDDLTQLLWDYDWQNRYILGSLPNVDCDNTGWLRADCEWQEPWDELTLFVYERYAREHYWPLTIRAVDFRNTLDRYFPIDRYSWEDRSSQYLTYQDGTYTRTVGDNHGARYCYLKSVSSMENGRFLLVFDYLDVPEAYTYEDVRAVLDHAGAKDDLQPAQFRAAVYDAFRDGVIPSETDMTELAVQVRLTGSALQPFYFLRVDDTYAYRMIG